jgi:hypothetical protein
MLTQACKDNKAQAFSVFWLLVAAIVAAVILVLLLNTMGVLNLSRGTDPTEGAARIVMKTLDKEGMLDEAKVLFTPNTTVTSVGIAGRAKANLSAKQICISAGMFKNATKSYFKESPDKTLLSYTGASPLQIRIVGFCADGWALAKNANKYFESVGVRKEWVEECPCVTQPVLRTQKCCFIAAMPEGTLQPVKEPSTVEKDSEEKTSEKGSRMPAEETPPEEAPKSLDECEVQECNDNNPCTIEYFSFTKCRCESRPVEDGRSCFVAETVGECREGVCKNVVVNPPKEAEEKTQYEKAIIFVPFLFSETYQTFKNRAESFFKDFIEKASLEGCNVTLLYPDEKMFETYRFDGACWTEEAKNPILYFNSVRHMQDVVNTMWDDITVCTKKYGFSVKENRAIVIALTTVKFKPKNRKARTGFSSIRYPNYVIVNYGSPKTMEHEIGHVFRLCEEYSLKWYVYWDQMLKLIYGDEKGCYNLYPAGENIKNLDLEKITNNKNAVDIIKPNPDRCRYRKKNPTSGKEEAIITECPEFDPTKNEIDCLGRKILWKGTVVRSIMGPLIRGEQAYECDSLKRIQQAWGCNT